MAVSRLKTTVYLDSETLRLIERAAREQRKSTAALIREAIKLYSEQLAPPRLKSVGCVRSKRGDLSERVDELLKEAFAKKR